MPSSISSLTCWPAGRRRGCTARSSTSSASPPRSRRRRIRASFPATSRSWPPPHPGTRSRSWTQAIAAEIAKVECRAGRRPLRWSAAIAQAEAHFISRLQTVGGFGGKSDQLNAYNVFLGDPAFFDRDLARYRKATAADLTRAAVAWLGPSSRVALSVVPRGRAGAGPARVGAGVGALMPADRTRLPAERRSRAVPVPGHSADVTRQRPAGVDDRAPRRPADHRPAAPPSRVGGRSSRPRRSRGDHRRSARRGLPGRSTRSGSTRRSGASADRSTLRSAPMPRCSA